MSKHTQGPWKIFTDPCGNMKVQAIYGSYGFDDSQLMPVDSLSPGINREANARLIAKAPEMYELCRRLKALLDDPHPGLSTWQDFFQDVCRKLAKIPEELDE